MNGPISAAPLPEVRDSTLWAGIKADPDTRPLTAKDFGNMVPVADMMKQRRGRPTTAAP